MNKQELTKKLEKLQNQINEVREEINNLNDYDFEPTPKSWKPEVEEDYYANGQFRCISEENINAQYDRETIKYNRVFKTEEECQLYCDIQRAFRDSSKEFVKNKNNYYPWYENEDDDIVISPSRICKNAILYFDSEETIKKLINKFGEENVKRYYLGVY